MRKDVAMTGEITLRGKILPIGGLKEKSLAALKEGISEILVPAENSADILELPDEVKTGLKVTTVRSVDEVLEAVLVRDAAGNKEAAENQDAAENKDAVSTENNANPAPEKA